MTLFDIACVVVGVWIVAAAVLSVPVGRAIRTGQQPAQPAEHPEPDADWLAPWPVDVPHDQPAIPLTLGERDRFADLVRGIR